MKICILTPRYPFPENGGDVLRINGIARYLKRRGHQLVLLSLQETYSSDSNEGLYDTIIKVHHSKLKGVIGALLALLFTNKPLQCGYYSSRSFQKSLKDVLVKEKPDLFISHLLRMAPYLVKESLQEKSIIEMTDALSVTYSLSDKADGFSIKKLVYGVEKRRIERFEHYVINNFKKVVLVSQKDVDYFKKEPNLKTDSLYCYKNGVDLESEEPRSYDPDKICFIGNMRTLQNQDAVTYYVNNVFPTILKSRPSAKLYIVGAQPSATILAMASSNIIVTGFVNSIYETICDACYVIAPIRIAAGIQNKVLFAMAYHIPVIMTSLISKAIPEAKDGVNCLLADNEEGFAALGNQLSTNFELRNRIGESGYQMVKEHYSWDSCLAGYEELT